MRPRRPRISLVRVRQHLGFGPQASEAHEASTSTNSCNTFSVYSPPGPMKRGCPRMLASGAQDTSASTNPRVSIWGSVLKRLMRSLGNGPQAFEAHETSASTNPLGTLEILERLKPTKLQCPRFFASEAHKASASPIPWRTLPSASISGPVRKRVKPTKPLRQCILLQLSGSAAVRVMRSLGAQETCVQGPRKLGVHEPLGRRGVPEHPGCCPPASKAHATTAIINHSGMLEVQDRPGPTKLGVHESLRPGRIKPRAPGVFGSPYCP